ncbi:MAG: S8 family serine peptidase [bacterium]|nr:S8 family serine peptidase [bacterium]
MKTSRLIASMVAVFLLAATVSVSPADTLKTDFQWDERPLTVTAVAGTITNIDVGFEWVVPDTDQTLRVDVTGPAADALSFDVDSASADGPGHYSIPTSITPVVGVEGVLRGSMRLKLGSANIGPAVPLRLTIVAPSASVIPSAATDPSPDRIGIDPLGLAVVRDEIVVGVALDSADPDATARNVASALSGVFTGAVPGASLYQIQVPGTDIGDLEGLIGVAEGIADVEFASRNYVDQNVDTAIPDDSEWNDWDVDNPGGNNWGLEWIDAPGAWDITTGDQDVQIAIIDLGNDEDHTDLDDNVSRTARNGSGSHGTHVAGTACAEGNNNKGTTGVTWDCDMKFYGAGSTTLVTAGEMVRAIDDGARVANMSLNYIENGDCTVDETTLVDSAREANDIFGRAVIYGDRNGADVLWVVAAGNDCGRNSLYTAPGGMAGRFPANTMAVAAIGRDGNLATFSNSGEFVSVAAPGVDIYSSEPRTGCFLGLGCDDNYGFKNGTSMASPHVTGLAALVIADDPGRSTAEVKSCIVSGSQSDGTEVPGHDFRTINAKAAVECSGTIDLPAEVDIVLALDLTSSMGGVLNQAKTELNELVDTLAAAAPGTDFRYSVVSYEDYPGAFSSAACPDSTYSRTYGASTDRPFRIDRVLTDDTSSVNTSINALTLGSGSDGPESYGRALWEIAQADTGATLGWRPDALRLIVNFGDNVPHDTDINEGVEGGTLAGDTGVDPGRNAVVDCGGDDIDFQDDALRELNAAGIRLLHVDSSRGSTMEPYWRSWVSLTNGSYAKLDEGRSLSDAIVELLTLL